jgi:hypothetical protein
MPETAWAARTAGLAAAVWLFCVAGSLAPVAYGSWIYAGILSVLAAMTGFGVRELVEGWLMHDLD